MSKGRCSRSYDAGDDQWRRNIEHDGFRDRPGTGFETWQQPWSCCGHEEYGTGDGQKHECCDVRKIGADLLCYCRKEWRVILNNINPVAYGSVSGMILVRSTARAGQRKKAHKILRHTNRTLRIAANASVTFSLKPTSNKLPTMNITSVTPSSIWTQEDSMGWRAIKLVSAFSWTGSSSVPLAFIVDGS